MMRAQPLLILATAVLAAAALAAQPATVISVGAGQAIPNPVPAGSIVQLSGTYAASHTSPNGLRIHGTLDRPVVIRSAGTTRAVATGGWEVTGAYYTIENIVFMAGVNLIAPNVQAVLRNSEWRGDGKRCAGVGINSYDPLAWNRFVTFAGNHVHSQGVLADAGDQDCHGVAIGERASDVWLHRNVLERNSGDGLQINSGNSRSSTRIQVTENTARQNKQHGLWTKQASEVVFARNTVSTHRPSSSSLGACVGGQYGPEHLWVIDNTLSDCDYGVQLASDLGDGADGLAVMVLGNTISNIRDTDGSDAKQGPTWASAAIALMGGTIRYVAENKVTTSTRPLSVNGSAYVDIPGMAASLRAYYTKRFGVVR